MSAAFASLPWARLRVGRAAASSSRSFCSTSRYRASGPQKPITASYYRGGTSRGLMIQPQDLPHDRTKWPSVFRQLMGSPDPYGRQLDGMGAGISSLSKICLVEPSPPGVRKDAIDYTFVGLGIETDEVDVAGNCGNMSSAIGPYAYNAGLIDKSQTEGEVSMVIRNTNTGKFITSTFQVTGGQAAVHGDSSIDGVYGTGANIKLDFESPYGSKTGKVLPTGNVVDEIAGYQVSCVDGANPAVFVRAEDVDIDGTILPNDFNKLPGKLALMERIRKAAAVAMGIAPSEDSVPRVIPKIAIVSKSTTAHPVLSGDVVEPKDADVVVRFLSDTQPHRAIPLTLALATAVAARIPGTIVEQALADTAVEEGKITIGHASGKIQVDATMKKGSFEPEVASVFRTARRIMDGVIYHTDGSTSAESGPSKQEGLGIKFVGELRDAQKKASQPIAS